ncbi:MAG TPA: hypothetical protein VFX19_02315 [Dehalococcoidia bacterium]|jgi:hypothetical protein|nr:hypothetical protein [Dehalococcoidia bacterium]
MCAFLVLILTGPRVGIVLWWLINPGRWDRAFDTFVWPVLGFIFLPWTTLMFVAVAPTGHVANYDWIWLGIAFFTDVMSVAMSGFNNRQRLGYA